MYRHFLLATTASVAVFCISVSAQAQISGGTAGLPGLTSVETVTVTAQKLAEARADIQTKLGASTYSFTAADIASQPGGDNVQLNQVILQAPGVAQDSFGQIHVRGEHNGLQYRLNGIIIPEGISVFSQSLDPRLAESVRLVTGALPAEYGLDTAGIVDVKTRTGTFNPGGQIGIYGGSHNEIEPSLSYGGSSGNFNYFVSGEYMTNSLGIESPDGRSSPNHDRTKQWNGFAYLEDILDDNSSLTGIFGTANDMFQIPNQAGLEPAGLDGIVGLGPLNPTSGDYVLQANGQTALPSQKLDERQREITHYGILSYLYARQAFSLQVSAFGRYSSLRYTPGANLGDLLYNGIDQTAYKRDEAYGLQVEGSYRVGPDHTLRAGAIYQADDIVSNTSSLVLPTAPGSASNPNPNPMCSDPANICQTSGIPVAIPDNGRKHAWSYSLYLQDEWQVLPSVTLNYGVRYDQFKAYDGEYQISPRANIVWKPTDTTTVHAGYARYFSPPPIENVSATDIGLFDNTTSAASHQDTTPKAERADYYDVGLSQQVSDALSVGLDSYFKASHNLVDEGQFGAPIILTPFNYKTGRQYGIEFTSNYDTGNFSAYFNASYERAAGRGIVSSEYQFDPADLAYIAAHYIPLDHQQIVSASAGASYTWHHTTFSTDFLFGSGLRQDGATPNGGHLPAYLQTNIGISRTFSVDGSDGYTARLDVINLFNTKYEIRNGTGIGVGAPQFGARRGFFIGLSKSL